MLRKALIILVTGLLSLALFSSGCTVSREDHSLQRVVNSGKLKVAGSGSYSPFNYHQGEEVVGFDVDVGKEIAKRLGVELEYVTTSWEGIIEGVELGRYDAILGSMAVTEKRKESVTFTIPYYYSGAQLFVHKDSGITRLSDFEGKTIAVATGTTFADDAEALGAEVKYYRDDITTLRELINGQVDGVITEPVVGMNTMAELTGGHNLRAFGELLRSEEMAIALSKDDKKLLEKINEILTEMHADGTLSNISKKWFDGVDITVK